MTIPRRRARWGGCLLGALVACTLPACVAEERDETEGLRRDRTVVRAEEGDPAAVLDAPIARPALEGRTVNARVVAAVEPLGGVPFDGQVLPLVGPDGTRLATQVGEWPGWESALATRAGGPTLRTSIEVWDVSGSPAARVNLLAPLRGVMLGRSCDDEGFLVEEILPDGSRRIGKADWRTGAVRWLVQNGRVNAFATLLPGGGLAWCARAVEDDAFDLMIDGRRAARAGEASYLFPMPGAGPGLVHVLASSAFGLELQTRSLRAGTVEGVARAGAEDGSFIVARRRIAPGGEAIVAYQAAEPARGAAGVVEGAPPGRLLFHPGAGRMVVFDPERGQVVALEDRSIAGCWARDGGGWAVLLTTPEGLEFQRVTQIDGLWEALPAARSLGDAHVARATTSESRPFVLIGPDSRDGRRVRVMGLELLRE